MTDQEDDFPAFDDEESEDVEACLPVDSWDKAAVADEEVGDE